MHIFYDFETSSKELIGQILSYAFIETNEKLEEVKRFCGTIKLNRTQLPDVGAIITNKINLKTLEESGDKEYTAAKKLHAFLESCVKKYGVCYLTGFNSNSFDINFLRNLLIRHGLDPYFKGKLKNKDILHYCQDLALNDSDSFPWQDLENKEDPEKPFYSFKLEKIATSFNCLQEAQSHDAIEDVELSIKLVKKLQNTFNSDFYTFSAIDIQINQQSQDPLCILEQISKGTPPEPLHKKYWLYISKTGKTNILLDLEKAAAYLKEHRDIPEELPLEWLRGINENKHYFKAKQNTAPETTQKLAEELAKNPRIQAIQKQPKHYYELIKKDWDIEYQIHELGFDLIPKLKNELNKLKHTPDGYTAILKGFLAERKKAPSPQIQATYNYCIQLFNRYYLNHHPSPDPEHLKRYIEPRYVTGELLKNWQDFQTPDLQYEILLEHIDITATNNEHLLALKEKYEDFARQFNLKRILD